MSRSQRYSSPHVMVAFLAFLVGTQALVCYHTDEETGELRTIENEEYAYCVLFPSKKTSYGDSETVADGVLEAEVDAPFETIFDQNMPGYQVMSFCMYEKYDWPSMWEASSYSSKFQMKAPAADYLFRCVCNFNLCNSPQSFAPYFGSSTQPNKSLD
uniref:Uncharacterized protein n=1 Tax=Acrobeloides nanus TaxID=290746 RepID=A0A914DEX4_9BILA